MSEDESAVVESLVSAEAPSDGFPQFTVCMLDRDDPKVMREVAGLWQRVYGAERGLLEVEDNAHAVEDTYHSSSDYLAVFVRPDVGAAETIIATVRVVGDSQVGLPIERFFPLGPFKRYTQLVEPQRLIVDPAWRRRCFDSAPYGLSGLLFKAVVKRYLLGGGNTTLVIDAFSDSRESPLHAFLKMGAQRIGASFHDSELASETPSVALLCSRYDITTQALRAEKSRFARYLLKCGQGD
ncbi:N-acyl amino acid synthase FeeM domain-containing protein [Burkholderia catarinensis]|uniref:N-acyl amino acid synthase FeeM domain-containing protein n=1 Tax=Burkholderia catarinensis TaxID=1108140 RepID=UPI00091D73A7|nr:hypothetical protein [Burkholderia catarinensis]KAG8148530.1 hypothetical protein BFF94_037455 [Burkholderia catarinensis]